MKILHMIFYHFKRYLFGNGQSHLLKNTKNLTMNYILKFNTTLRNGKFVRIMNTFLKNIYLID